jgi:hypothetical protein
MMSPARYADTIAVLTLAMVLATWLARSTIRTHASTTPVGLALEDVVALVAFAVLCVRALATDRYQQQNNSQPSAPPPVEARTVSYSPFRGSVVAPGGAPLPAARNVADKLDDTISVMDFIPQRLHAAIRSSTHLKQGNADVTQYVQAALDFVGCNTTKPRIGPVATRSAGSVHFPGGLYYISNLHINASMKLAGEFLDNTTLYAVPGTKGPMLQDKGDAAKVTIQDLMIHGGDEPGVTAGIQLGLFTGKPGGSPWGTYAYLTNIESRNIPKGCGIRLKVNVCTMYNVWTAGTQDGILNMSGGVALFAFGCGAAGFTRVGIQLQQSDYWCGVEMEAPENGAIPVLLQGPATIDGIIISLECVQPLRRTMIDHECLCACNTLYSVTLLLIVLCWNAAAATAAAAARNLV